MTAPAPRSTAARAELLAPAGDREALRAALASGADAVYFGLDEGFNARARATNFPLAELPQTCAEVHRAGAKVYLTLNTLVFEPELARLEEILRGVAAAGVDALIVQDPAVALIARALCPSLELHASTQMTICNADAERFARRLGVTRVVVPRELSLDEIRQYREESELEVEVFVHGALCVSWSGQCLTSEAWGGRSANRGQCAQSCRMPYELILDGEKQDHGETRYLLSPRDLAGARHLPGLLELGVEGLKIEGRQKSALYVATATRGYRRWLDALARNEDRRQAETQLALDLRDMGSAYTRGFSPGFLSGSDHQHLVDGRFPKHRGHLLGIVRGIQGDEVSVERAAPPDDHTVASAPVEPAPGMGIGFDLGRPEAEEPGGPLYRVRKTAFGWVLGFGRIGPDLSRVAPGQRVWLTSDPTLEQRCATAQDLLQRLPLELRVRGELGSHLVVDARASAPFGALRAHAESETPLAQAQSRGLDRALLEEKLAAFGGTAFRLEKLDASALRDGLFLPPPALKALRRTLVEQLEFALERGPERAIEVAPALPRVAAALRDELAAAPRRVPASSTPELVLLVRTAEQLEAVLETELPEVELDWMELVGLRQARERVAEAGRRAVLATLRVTKPGERAFDTRLLELQPDGLLVRHLGALELFAALPASERPLLHGDFSLNATNSLTAALLLARSLETITPSHDLDAAQLDALLGAVDPSRLTATMQARLATFHTEHCVYAHLLSEGRDYKTCGRPCEKHQLSLRDHLGQEHPVIVDAGCRNTVFHHKPQTSAVLVPRLLSAGVRRFRVELVREDARATRRVIEGYRKLLAGRIEAQELARELGAEAHIGVAKLQRTLV
ncbi:MAG: DUF3656 domain-containing protein [Planctomycetes bacterium]|nr:DUF3656 domain-containing protein [Planctomycetota bacterium]